MDSYSSYLRIGTQPSKKDALQNYFATHLFLWSFIVGRMDTKADRTVEIVDKASNIADKRAGIADKAPNIADKSIRIADRLQTSLINNTKVFNWTSFH